MWVFKLCRESHDSLPTNSVSRVSASHPASGSDSSTPPAIQNFNLSISALPANSPLLPIGHSGDAGEAHSPRCCAPVAPPGPRPLRRTGLLDVRAPGEWRRPGLAAEAGAGAGRADISRLGGADRAEESGGTQRLRGPPPSGPPRSEFEWAALRTGLGPAAVPWAVTSGEEPARWPFVSNCGGGGGGGGVGVPARAAGGVAASVSLCVGLGDRGPLQSRGPPPAPASLTGAAACDHSRRLRWRRLAATARRCRMSSGRRPGAAHLLTEVGVCARRDVCVCEPMRERERE